MEKVTIIKVMPHDYPSIEEPFIKLSVSRLSIPQQHKVTELAWVNRSKNHSIFMYVCKI